MADKKYSPPPGIDLLQDNAINMDSDRARRINSLHRNVDELIQEQNKKRLQVSNEVNTLTKQQKKMMSQLEYERSDMTNDVAQGYSNVLKGLGKTISSLATGVKSITLNTGRATTDAISQYGRAISEDININKTNTVAMALSKATPLFGYFAAKFMETDVFQSAASRIKERVGNAMSEGLSKAGESISNIFRKGKDVMADEKERKPATVADLEALKNDMDLPHLQEGGYVKQGGVVEVHAAEVVTPIDKLLKQIDESKNADIANKLNATMNIMSERMSNIETIVVNRDERQANIIDTFMKEFKEARSTKESDHQKRLLKAILELKVAMIGTTSRLRIAWQRTLLQHPTFRSMLLMGDIMKTAIISPLQFLFGARGGYAGDVRSATSTHNVFQKISNVLSILYTNLLPKIDDVVIYTKASAEALTGGPITGSHQKTYTFFDKIKEFMTSRSLKSEGQNNMFESFQKMFGLDKDSMAGAGISSFKDFLSPKRFLSGMGFGKENIIGKLFEGTFLGELRTTFNNVAALTRMKKDQEKREGPHSPSMAQNIAMTAKATEGQFQETKGVGHKLKGLAERAWEIAIFLGGMLKDMFFKGIGSIKGLLGPIAAFLGGFLKDKIKNPFSKKGMQKIGTKLGGAGGTAAKYGSKALGMAGKGLGLAGRGLGVAAGAIASGAIGAGMSIWDAIQAIRNPEGFMGNFLIRGLSAFIGGTDTGFAGAKHGALKGAALGAAAGSIIPGLGTMIGGAIGAAAGGILGFVGGKKISEGISKTLDNIAKFAKGIWNIVTFPVKVMKEALKSVWVIAKWGFNKMFGGVIERFKAWWGKPGIATNMFDGIMNFFRKVVKAIKGAFAWIWKKLDLKERLFSLMFPIVTIGKVFTTVRDMIDENMEKIPVIGAIYKKVKSTVKSIHEGTFASDLDKTLNGNQSARGVTAVNERQLTQMQKFYREQRAHSKKLRDKQWAEDRTAGRSPMMDRLIKSSNYTETKTLQMSNKRMERLEKGLDRSIKDGAKQTVQAYAQVTNLAASNNNSVNNSGGGGAGSGYSFSSGDRFASNVTQCNIN